MDWVNGLLGGLAGAGWLAFGIIALRMSGVKRDRDKADAARKEQAEEAKKATTALADQKKRAAARIEDLENEIKQLETELDSCTTPGSRRRAINRLLQKASSARRDAADGVL